jgi:hypothetical protein
LLDKARKWILEQGYPLEMRTAKVFREAGFDVQQAQLYTDTESGKKREIDLFVIAPDYLGVTRIVFAIECKSAKKPWVLFTSNVGTGQNIFWTYSLMSESARKVLADRSWNDPDNRSESPHLAMFDRLRWLRKKKETAYSFRQAFTDTDTAYTALLSSIKAASHFIRTKSPGSFPHFRLAFPLVVVDSPLLICSLNSENEPEIREVQSGEILFTNPDQDGDSTCIRVVTIEGLPDFVSEARVELQKLRYEFKTEEAVVWREHFGTEMPDHPNEIVWGG